MAVVCSASPGSALSHGMSLRPDSDIDLLPVVERLPNGRMPQVREFEAVDQSLGESPRAAAIAGCSSQTQNRAQTTRYARERARREAVLRTRRRTRHRRSEQWPRRGQAAGRRPRMKAAIIHRAAGPRRGLGGRVAVGQVLYRPWYQAAQRVVQITRCSHYLLPRTTTKQRTPSPPSPFGQCSAAPRAIPTPTLRAPSGIFPS
jgi:hypothetical protein